MKAVKIKKLNKKKSTNNKTEKTIAVRVAKSVKVSKKDEKKSNIKLKKINKKLNKKFKIKNVKVKSLNSQNKNISAKRGPYKKRTKSNTIISVLLKLILTLGLIIAAYFFMLNFDSLFNINTTNTTSESISQNKTSKKNTFKDKYIGDIDFKKYPYLKNDLIDKGIELTEEDISFNKKNTDYVVKGKDEWIFYIGKNEKKILEGERFISAEWFMTAANRMDELDKLCKEQNKEVYFLIVPMKELIYPEYLPDGYMEKQNEIDDLELFSKYTNEKRGLNLLYPLEFMKKAKEYVRLYFTKDVHWNQIGGYIAAEDLYEKMGKTPKPISVCDFMKNTESLNGDYDYEVLYKGDGEVLTFDTHGKEIAYATLIESTSDAKDEREITLVGDSFRYWIYNVLQHDFKKSNIIHKSIIKKRQTKEVLKKSDIIVIQVLSEAYGELPYMVADIVNQIKD